MSWALDKYYDDKGAIDDNLKANKDPQNNPMGFLLHKKAIDEDNEGYSAHSSACKSKCLSQIIVHDDFGDIRRVDTR